MAKATLHLRCGRVMRYHCEHGRCGWWTCTTCEVVIDGTNEIPLLDEMAGRKGAR